MTEIRLALDFAALDGIRVLFREYAESLGFSLDFQQFEQELATLPGRYAPPGGTILLALVDGQTAGCVALRPLEPGICEMKRLYVRPAFRGSGAGRALVQATIERAAQAGYQRMRLDTLATMTAARGLYESLGFSRVAPYCFNPMPDACYYQLVLPRPAR
ncbi:MAG: GNAT family N-acetyltransferase [Phycisphaerae bacterium]